jgi:SAM-dependent methyltransferase
MTDPRMDRVARAFDRATPTYAREAQVQRRLAERLALRIAETIPMSATTRACELGCGIGTATAELLRRGVSGEHWSFVDVSATSIALHEGIYASHFPKAQWHHANAECFQLPLDCRLVVASSVLHWFRDLPRFFARAAVPGRWFAFAVYGTRTLEDLRSSYERVMGERFPSPVVYRSLREMAALLTKSGLRVVRLDRLSLEHRCVDLRSALVHLRETGVNPTWNGASRRVRLSPRLLQRWSQEFSALHERDGLCSLRYDGEVWIAATS